MAQRTNYVVVTGPGGIESEMDLATCSHCQFQIQVPPAKDGHVISRVLPPCSGCGKFICSVCAAKGRCDPWEKKMERAERRFALRRSMGLEG